MSERLDASQFEIKRAIARRVQWLKSRGLRRKIKPPAPVFPKSAERGYRKDLSARANKLWDKVQKGLIPHLEGIVNSFRQENGLPQVKKDSAREEFGTIIDGIKTSFYSDFTDEELAFLIRKRGLEVNDSTLQQFKKQFKTVLGLDPLVNEPWLSGKLANYVAENVNLIESIDDKFFAEVQDVVFRGASQGLSSKDLADQIKDRFDVSHSRYDLIARDQVGKLTGQLNQSRQVNAGFTRYIWRTSMDERVRPEHEEREGEVFSWDEPPPDGHPGQPIQCRCYAEPIFEDLVDENE